MIRSILLSAALVLAFGAGAASAGEQDTVRRAFVKNRQIKWQTVRADAPHPLTGVAAEKAQENEPSFRVAPRARNGYRR